MFRRKLVRSEIGPTTHSICSTLDVFQRYSPYRMIYASEIFINNKIDLPSFL